MKQLVGYPPLRPFVGGAVIAASVYLLDTEAYIGLGIPITVAAFDHPSPWWDSVGKFVYTVASLGSGFKEVR